MKFPVNTILKHIGKAIPAYLANKIGLMKKDRFGYNFKNGFQNKWLSAAIYNRFFSCLKVYQLIRLLV